MELSLVPVRTLGLYVLGPLWATVVLYQVTKESVLKHTQSDPDFIVMAARAKEIT